MLAISFPFIFFNSAHGDLFYLFNSALRDLFDLFDLFNSALSEMFDLFYLFNWAHSEIKSLLGLPPPPCFAEPELLLLSYPLIDSL